MTTPDGAKTQALIWSNQHGMWWRQNNRGYTAHLAEAGVYHLDEARRIVADATCDGQLVRERIDPVTGVEYTELDEVVVPVVDPELTGWAKHFAAVEDDAFVCDPPGVGRQSEPETGGDR